MSAGLEEKLYNVRLSNNDIALVVAKNEKVLRGFLSNEKPELNILDVAEIKLSTKATYYLGNGCKSPFLVDVLECIERF